MNIQKVTNVKCTTHIDNETCFCPIEGIIEVISKKWAILIIAIIGNNDRIRFNKIKEILINISPKTLSDRLRELSKEGLIVRDIFAEIPPRVEYSLTQDGIEFRNSMKPLLDWASKRENKDK